MGFFCPFYRKTRVIKKHQGLLSFAELEKRGIVVPNPGGNEWSQLADKRKDLHKYVHLTFIDDHPMLYRAKGEKRITNPVWLKIDSSILLDEGVKFCSDVSNKVGTVILNAEEAEEAIDFEVLFTFMDWKNPEISARRRAAKKSEILVPNFVPIEKILGAKNG